MRASAIIVGPQEGAGAALRATAHGIGFSAVLTYESIGTLERQALSTPICFVLCTAVPDIAQLRPIAEAVRFSTNRKVRFAPLIYFAESPSAEIVSGCIALGFDDVIIMPFTRTRLRERLSRQIGTPLVYYETPTYFGPDRRRRDRPDSGGGHHRRLEITRSLLTGITVLRDENQVAL